MRRNIKLYTFKAIALFSIVLLTASCKNTNNQEIDSSEAGTVKIKMLGVNTDDEIPIKLGSTNRSAQGSLGEQTTIVPFNNEYSLVATLVPERSSQSLRASANGTKAMTVTEKLPAQVKYTVSVFDPTKVGKSRYVKSYYFTAGQETGNEIKGLTVGKTYDFVVTSLSTESYTLPIESSSVGYMGNNQGVVTVFGGFSYYKTSLTIGSSTTYLNAILKHKLSEITTKIDASAIGNITAIDAGVPSNHDLVYVDIPTGDITSYPGLGNTKAIEFPTVGTPIITSKPTVIAMAATTSAELVIKSITIDGITKSNLKVTGLSVTPGVRYNLNLKMKKSTDDVKFGNLIWATGDLAYTGPANGNGTYYFDDASHVGKNYQATKYWRSDAATIPDDGIREYDAPNPYTNNICAKMGAGWRIPTLDEFNSFIGGAGVPGSAYSGAYYDYGDVKSATPGYMEYRATSAANSPFVRFYVSGDFKRNGGTDPNNKDKVQYQVSDGGGVGGRNYNVAQLSGNSFAMKKLNNDDRTLIRCVKNAL